MIYTEFCSVSDQNLARKLQRMLKISPKMSKVYLIEFMRIFEICLKPFWRYIKDHSRKFGLVSLNYGFTKNLLRISLEVLQRSFRQVFIEIS